MVVARSKETTETQIDQAVIELEVIFRVWFWKIIVLRFRANSFTDFYLLEL